MAATQTWLNETYRKVSGFNKVPEDGRTGWPTIYGLRRALQYEMGITALSDNFGDGTTAKFKSVVEPTLNNANGKPKSNIVKIIQGAFWCKGINPNTGRLPLDGIYSNKPVKTFQGMAGISQDGKMTAMMKKALLDMSAFALVPGGDSNIRSMQQELNRKYNQYFGLLSCDGIYQRDTNTALIYALQAEIGMGVGVANGYYGTGTIGGTPTLVVGNTGNKVKILQWGLYVNGFNKGAQFDGNFTNNIASEVYSFRTFMKLTPYNSVADLTVIRGLLTSSGNQNRFAEGRDMATQLNKQQAIALKGDGVTVVGRYLTGSVGVGANKRDKNLTDREIKDIVDSGLRIFPIYQDGGWDEQYFTAEQGKQDGAKAFTAAFNLGFPSNSTIYFAVDTDIQDGNISGTALKYIEAVKKQMDSYGMFKVGIYGTRNVCQRAISAGFVENCFVSNMSTGFSGNLGFAMPQKWAFDQFYEHSNPGYPVDMVAVSGRDLGANKFISRPDNLKVLEGTKLYKEVMTILGYPFKDISLSLDSETVVTKTPMIEMYSTLKGKWTISNNKSGLSININNKKTTSKVYLEPIRNTTDTYKHLIKGSYEEKVETIINKLAPTVEYGMIETGLCSKNGMIGTKLVIKKQLGSDSTTGQMQLEIEVYIRPAMFEPTVVPISTYNNSYNNLVNIDSALDSSLKLAMGLGTIVLVSEVLLAAPVAVPMGILFALITFLNN